MRFITFVSAIAFSALLSAFTPLRAQTSTAASPPQSRVEEGWYLGLEGGLPFGVSTFSSFGADKTRMGWAAGLQGGYRFNPVFSLEVAARWGSVRLSAGQCCIDSHYWLGSDAVRYLAPVLDMNGACYADLQSKVSFQRYGLRLPVNLLGLLPSTRDSRWRVEATPELSLIGTKAKVTSEAQEISGTASSNQPLVEGGSQWHVGIGGQLSASYRLTGPLSAGLYSSLTHLTGHRLDGIPEHHHKANFLWESGLRLTWSFGSGKKKAALAAEATAEVARQQEAEQLAAAQAEAEAESRRQAEAVAKAKEAQVEAEETARAEAAARAEAIARAAEEERNRLNLPTIYFSFNSVWIEPGEKAKLRRFLQELQAKPEATIIIEGWSDQRGSQAANRRVSAARAEAVKHWLVRRGIDESRITTKGCGSDYTSPTDQARRAESGNNVNLTGKEGQK